MSRPKNSRDIRMQKPYQLLRLKYKTFVVEWIPDHCGIKGNEIADAFAKKGTTIMQSIDWPMTFHTMKTLIRREFHTSMCDELKARTNEKRCTVAHSEITGWPRIEAVAEFSLRTGQDDMSKYLHTQSTCILRKLQEEIGMSHLIWCPA
ncbi:unnamed protein product [Rodentolepis nana]|uniref:RNase H domain-containing protein n=1 Tax=Rodentolepis nana TaxID=102285 RepID=A0A0R3T5C3_RODNA|nr:unnamed protein product [Rodentolepis nana]